MGHKRMKTVDEGRANNGMEATVTKHNVQRVDVPTADAYLRKKYRVSNVIDYSDPSSVSNLIDGLDRGEFGSVTKELEALIAQRLEILNPLYSMYPELMTKPLNGVETQEKDAKKVIDVMDAKKAIVSYQSPLPVVIVDSDEESGMDKKPKYPFQEIFLGNPATGFLFENPMTSNDVLHEIPKTEEKMLTGLEENGKANGVYVGTEEDSEFDEDNQQS